MSSQDTYFPAQGWIDRIVPFSEAQHDKYKLTEKLSEKVSLCTEEEWAEYRYRSQAWATFVCVNEATNNEAIMKIWMQIPHRGSTDAPANIRKDQACSEPPPMAIDELETLNVLEAAGCTSTPRIQKHKQIKQETSEMVPGEYLCFFLMNRVPGVSLGDLFWKLDREERDAIRKAFKATFMEVLNAGIINLTSYRENLIWDKDNSKLYMVDFKFTCPAEDTDQWENREMITWQLGESKAKHRNDMSNWTRI